MRRPPDRKLIVAMMLLVAAASAALSRPVVFSEPSALMVTFAKIFGRS